MNDLENTADPSWTTNHSSDPTPVSLHCNQAGHSIDDVILIPLELMRSNRDAVRRAREAHLIHKGNTISLGNKHTWRSSLIYDTTQSSIPETIQCFYCHIFKFLFVTNFYFYFHFSFSPWRRFVFKPKYWAICLNIYIFCFILLFTSSSPCRRDQFAVLYFSTSLIVLIQVYNWEIRHHSLVFWSGFANILNFWRVLSTEAEGRSG